MSDKDDQDWIDLLAGQSVPDADPETVREAQVFRAALLAHSEKSKDDTEMPHPAIWEKLLARIEIEKAATEPRISRATEQHYDPPLALAASVLIAVLIMWIVGPIYPSCRSDGPSSDDLISRSGLPCVNNIVNPQTRTIAAHLQKELKALGIKTKTCQIEQGLRIKTTLPAVRSPVLEDLLTRYNNLTVLPKNNFLCINILDEKPE